MSNHSKDKKLKRLGKPCPDCGSKNTYLILMNEESGGAVYSEKYFHCEECDFLEIYKDKKNKCRSKDEYIDTI